MAKKRLGIRALPFHIKMCNSFFSVVAYTRIMCDKKYYDLGIVVVFRLLR